MAFVFGKGKKNSVFETKKEGPGPGEYVHEGKETSYQPAPFNMSTEKISTFDVPITTTGPGSYNPVSQNAVLSDKKLLMSSSFCSKVDRFKSERSHTEGKTSNNMKVSLVNQKEERRSPTAKENYKEMVERAKQKMQALQQANNRRRIDSIGAKRQFVRIVLSNPKNTEKMHSVYIDNSIIKKDHGPGSYNPDNVAEYYHNKSMHVVDWSRNNNKRFKSQKNKNPGPGYYAVDDGPKKSGSMSSAFAYRGLRSFMDEVIYKTKMPFKVQIIEQKNLKDRYPGPGQYEPRMTSSKSFHYGQVCFGSAPTEDQQTKMQFERLPGPGHYNLQGKNAGVKDQLRKTRQKIFGKQKPKPERIETLQCNNKEEVRKQCQRDMETQANKFYSLQQRCSSKIGNIPQAQRFKNEEQHRTTIPGPGQYRPIIQNEEKYQRGIQYGFNSTAGRSLMQNNPNGANGDLPFYDVDRNDLGKRALRIKKNIENLKQIDIVKAPFNCRQKRFDESPARSSPKEKGDRSKDMTNFDWNGNEADHRRNTRFKTQGQAKDQAAGSSAFKSRTKRSWIAPANVVGPGDYFNTSSMQKKSFNHDYNYRPPIKIRPSTRTRSSLA